MDVGILLVLLLIGVIHFPEIESGFKEKELLNYLFKNTRTDAHNPLERPSKNYSDPIVVQIRVFLTQIINLDMKNEIFHVNLWMYMKWDDNHVQWDPELFGGIKRIMLPPNILWKPDIVLFNSAEDINFHSSTAKIRANYNTAMLWGPSGVFKATCSIDVTWFPFDEQECSLTFGSWAYPVQEFDLALDCTKEFGLNDTRNDTESCSIDLNSYRTNSEFKIIYSSIQRSLYNAAHESFAKVNVTVGIHRISLYYIFNYFLPCVVVSIMSILVFALPCDSGEKISLGVTVLLSMTMFLLLVADKLPQSSSGIPLICKYFMCTIILCSLSIVFTVIVLNFHYRSILNQAVPLLVKIVINRWMAKLIFMKIEDIIETNKYVNPDGITENNDEISKTPLKPIDGYLSDIITREWKFAARVIDRICLVVFSLILSVATLVIVSKISK